jgi:ParB/RepB/Spo0J family partition protein
MTQTLSPHPFIETRPTPDWDDLTALLIVEPDPESWMPTAQAIGQAGFILDCLEKAFQAHFDLSPRLWLGAANDEESLFGLEGRFAPIHTPDVFGRGGADAVRKAQAALPVIGEPYRSVKLGAIVRDSPLQLRAPFDPEHDEDDAALLESLASDGQRVPVLLVETPESQPPTFTILDGHRRIAALRQMGHETVKALIFNHESAEYLITLTANVRKHLTPLQQARAISRLRERHGLTIEAIARRVGLSSRYITELRALLETDPAIQAALERGEIKAKTALALGQALREHQPRLAEIAAAHGLSEADARRLVARIQDTGETPEQAARVLGIGISEGGDSSKPSMTCPGPGPSSSTSMPVCAGTPPAYAPQRAPTAVVPLPFALCICAVTTTSPYGPPLYEATMSPPVPALRRVWETISMSPLRSVQLGPRLVEFERSKSSLVGQPIGVFVGVLVGVFVGVLVGVGVASPVRGRSPPPAPGCRPRPGCRRRTRRFALPSGESASTYSHPSEW